MKKTGMDQHTFFQYKGFQEGGNFNAADVGNYHAGFTGIFAGVTQREQYTWAGFGEMAKDVSKGNMGSAFSRLRQIVFNVSPNGDRVIDFRWNTKGMVDAARIINKR